MRLEQYIHGLYAVAVADHVERRARADEPYHFEVGIEIEQQLRVRLRDVAKNEPIRQKRFPHV
jgi:hypothetical protein